MVWSVKKKTPVLALQRGLVKQCRETPLFNTASCHYSHSACAQSDASMQHQSSDYTKNYGTNDDPSFNVKGRLCETPTLSFSLPVS